MAEKPKATKKKEEPEKAGVEFGSRSPCASESFPRGHKGVGGCCCFLQKQNPACKAWLQVVKPRLDEPLVSSSFFFDFGDGSLHEANKQKSAPQVAFLQTHSQQPLFAFRFHSPHTDLNRACGAQAEKAKKTDKAKAQAWIVGFCHQLSFLGSGLIL